MRQWVIPVFSVLILASCGGALKPSLVDERRLCYGREEGSIDACTRIIERSAPQDVLIEAYINRGAGRIATGDVDGGLADMQAVIDLDPEDHLAYFNRGRAYLELNLPAKALPEFDKSIELDPDYAPSYVLRAEAHHMSGQDERALLDYEKALSLDSRDPIIYYNRAVTYYRAENYEAALEDLGKAIRLRQSYQRAYTLRGDIHRKLKQHDAAIADFLQAIRRGSGSAETRKYLAWEFLAIGKSYRAVEFAENAAEREPGDPEMHNTLAHALMARGDEAAANAAFGEAIKNGGYNLIWAYQESLTDKGYAPGQIDGKDRPSLREALASCVRDNCQPLVR